MTVPLPPVAALLAALLATGVGLVYSHHQSRQLFIDWQAVQAQRDELDIEWELLQLEQSTLATDAEVDQKARGPLQMLIPGPAQVIYVAP